jgi:hypothetical protein
MPDLDQTKLHAGKLTLHSDASLAQAHTCTKGGNPEEIYSRLAGSRRYRNDAAQMLPYGASRPAFLATEWNASETSRVQQDCSVSPRLR